MAAVIFCMMVSAGCTALGFFDSDKAPGMTAYLRWTLIVLAQLGAGVLAWRLNQAAGRSSKTISIKASVMPWLSTAGYLAVFLSLHYGAWIPVMLAALLALPCVLLPPLLFCVTEHELQPSSPLLNWEEVCRVQDAAFSSPMVREFRRRYPHSRAYVYFYKSQPPHCSGGLLLHSQEPLPIANPANIEVTLNCPFTRKPGVLAEGKESLQACLARHSKQGTVLAPLPAASWDEWLQGYTKRQWREFIQSLDEREPNGANRGDLPQQLDDAMMNWQPIVLT